MNEIRGVSFVICCYNSSGRITPTLEHLQRLSTDIRWEVILVDNNSSDDTVSTANRVWNNNPVADFKILEEKNPGLMNARIKGVTGVSYEIISFIDDDNWVDQNWVENVYRVFSENKTVGACGGDSIGVFEKHPPEWFKD